MPDGEPREGSGSVPIAAQILGLGRDVDSLRRVVDRHDRTVRTVAGRLADLETQVGSSATTLAGLSEQMAELAGSDPGSGAHGSWFEMTDLTEARSRLVDLVHWLKRVYFQFPAVVLDLAPLDRGGAPLASSFLDGGFHREHGCRVPRG